MFRIIRTNSPDQFDFVNTLANSPIEAVRNTKRNDEFQFDRLVEVDNGTAHRENLSGFWVYKGMPPEVEGIDNRYCICAVVPE
jgi:hypothetical protein